LANFRGEIFTVHLSPETTAGFALIESPIQTLKTKKGKGSREIWKQKTGKLFNGVCATNWEELRSGLAGMQFFY